MNTQTKPSSFQAPLAAVGAGGSRPQAAAPSANTPLGLRSVAAGAKRLKGPQNGLPGQELLGLAAQLVSGLPAPLSMRLNVPGAPVPVVLWTGHIRPQSREATPVLANSIVFDAAELDAIVCACESDRLWHADFLGLCFEKWRRPEVPVRAAELLDGANADQSASWTFGRVLARLGLEIETIELDENEPVVRSLYEAA